MGRIRVGLVGAGGVAAEHYRVLSQEADAEVVGISDVDPARLESRSREWGVPAFADLDALLAVADAVFVCTPPAHHRVPTERAAAVGKHVFCEKPIALTLEDADAMIAACARAGVCLQIGTNFHFHPAYRTMRRLFHSGELGELATCWMRLLQYFPLSGWEARRQQDHWRMRPEDSGGRLFEQIHLVNWLHWVGGPVRAVYGHALSVAPDLPVDDLDLAVLAFDRGYGVAELSMTPTTVNEASCGILGTLGGVTLREGRLRRRRRDAADEEEVPVEPAVSRQRHFLDCVRQGRAPETDGADGRRSLAVCLAFSRAAREGRVVRLEEVEPGRGRG
jgi:UDP-N-acetyl-2-amino-2-deoxyglucuronate dehydrogenase